MRKCFKSMSRRGSATVQCDKQKHATVTSVLSWWEFSYQSDVIDIILQHFPLQNLVSTSTLSKKWRYKGFSATTSIYKYICFRNVWILNTLKLQALLREFFCSITTFLKTEANLKMNWAADDLLNSLWASIQVDNALICWFHLSLFYLF